MRLGIDASNISRGGGVTHLRELLAAANPSEHGFKKVIVWGSRKTLDLIDDRLWLKKCSGVWLEKGILHRLMWQRFVLPGLARASCDILFIPGGNGFGSFRPFVAMSQNLLPFDSFECRRFGLSLMRLRYRLLRHAQTRTFQRADGTIFLTRSARDVVERVTGKLGNSTIIPHGISPQFRMKPNKQRKFEEITRNRPFRWLYVSIVNYYKHQWHVVRAVDELLMCDMPLALDLVGPAYPPAYKYYLRETRNLPSRDSAVRYHGAIAHDELATFYRDADGFVFASSCENMPIILLEAMAAGLPIACSDRGPMPEILGDAGVYFDPESPEQIAKAMSLLMNDAQKCEEYANRAFEYAAQYTWERCARESFSFFAVIGRQKGL